VSATPARRRVPFGVIFLVCVAAPLYAVMLAGLGPDEGTDAAGRGLAQAFALLFGIALWIVIAILLLVAVAKGRMPLAATLALVILLPASAVGAVCAMELSEKKGVEWLAVPALLPPVFVLYALWARFPSLQIRLPPGPVSLVFGIAIVALTAMPIVSKELGFQPDPEREARLIAAEKAREAEEEHQVEVAREREAAAFAKLGPDSPLADYLPFRYGDRAHEVQLDMRRVRSRQSDIVAMLQSMPLHEVPELTELDLHPTAELCQAYGAALGNAASQISPQKRSDYLTAAMDLEYELPTIRWLRGAGCNLDGPLDRAAANIDAVADSDRLRTLARTLAALKKGP
jgi:hypothetical protein